MPRMRWPWPWLTPRNEAVLPSPRPRKYEPPHRIVSRRFMITFLHGSVVETLPTQIVVDVHGVGYEVLIPLSSYDKLPRRGMKSTC